MQEEVLDDLEGLFGEVRVNHGGPNRPAVEWTCEGHPPLRVKVSKSSSTDLMAHFVWQSSMTLASLLAGERLEQVNVSDKTTVLELGAGSALPSIVCDTILGAKQVVATDYPDPDVLAAMEENARTNKCQSLKVLGYDWAQDPSWLLDQVGGKFDVILCADTLWMRQYHSLLRHALQGLVRDDQTQVVFAYMDHDHDGNVARSFFEEMRGILSVISEQHIDWRSPELQESQQRENTDYGDVHIKVCTRAS